jgi:hypothetical protein
MPHGTINLWERCPYYTLASNEHNVPSGDHCGQAQAHRFANKPFDAIPSNRIAKPAAD